MPWWHREDGPDKSLSRRDFFRLFGGDAVDRLRPGGEPPTRRPPPRAVLPQRPLGRTGAMVPILGFGTAPLGRSREVETGAALLNEAIDLGVTLIDAGSTGGGYGRAGAMVGEVMVRRRPEVFLALQLFEPDGTAGRRALEESLRELRTNDVDLLVAQSLGQEHMDPEVVFGPNGIFRMLLQARQQGLCRYIGASCESRAGRLLDALRDYDLDVVMTPANFVDAHGYGFERSVRPIAGERGCGLVATKVFGGPRPGEATPALLAPEHHALAFRYALSLAGSASAVIGMVGRRELHENVQRARAFQPLTAEEWALLERLGPELATEWGAHLGPP